MALVGGKIQIRTIYHLLNKSKSITFYINQLALTYLPYNVL